MLQYLSKNRSSWWGRSMVIVIASAWLSLTFQSCVMAAAVGDMGSSQEINTSATQSPKHHVHSGIDALDMNQCCALSTANDIQGKVTRSTVKTSKHPALPASTTVLLIRSSTTNLAKTRFQSKDYPAIHPTLRYCVWRL